MSAAMNGIAAARRLHPLWRHVLGVLRLCPRRDPPLRADGHARHLRADPRFDRPGRGRPDPSAGRAFRHAARDAEPASYSAPATRSRPRSAGSLRSTRIRTPSALVLSRQNLPTLRTSRRRQLFRPRRLCARRSRRRARRNAARDRLGSVARGGGGQGAKALGKRAAVVSMPCWDLFEAQPAEYRAAVLARRRASRSRRRSASAGTATSASMARSSACTASAPAPRRASSIKHFGITVDAAVAAAKALMV